MCENRERFAHARTSFPFTQYDLKLDHDYRIVGELGSGAYSTVLRAIDLTSGQTFAIKRFINALESAGLARHCLREIEILSALKQDNIVKLHSAMRRVHHDDHSVYMVLDCMPSDLRRFIHSPILCTRPQIQSIMYQLFLALNYLHAAKVTHRDIKPANILINERYEVKLCDFGLARSVHGLKISAYDFDAIYRHEFADSDKLQTTGIPSQVNSAIEDPDDMDEHVSVNRVYSDRAPPVPAALPFAIPPGPHSQAPLMEATFLRPIMPDNGEQMGEHAAPEEEKLPKAIADPSDLRAEFVRGLKPDPNMVRELSSHVASRWYRPPEVILLEKVYCSPVDMWGAGCVFAELLQMLPGNKNDYQDRKALFPGTSCFPLSPEHSNSNEGHSPRVSPEDQLAQICRVLGTPSEEDLGFIADLGAKQYVRQLPKTQGIDLKALFPASSYEELQLLQRLLVFNPHLRITAKEALRDPYFRKVRSKSKEIEPPPLVLTAHSRGDACLHKLLELIEPHNSRKQSQA